MIQVEMRKGLIVPLGPLPPDWEEGAVLEVAKTGEMPLDIDLGADSMNQLCADSAREDEETMRAAIEALFPLR